MLPTVEERLDSVIRALSEVVIAGLPAEAKLAREQVQLSIGHLTILRDQIAIFPSIEREELDDAVRFATDLLRVTQGGERVQASRKGLEKLVSAESDGPAAERCRVINSAISDLVEASCIDGDPETRTASRSVVLRHETATSNKHRSLLKCYGFDVQ